MLQKRRRRRCVAVSTQQFRLTPRSFLLVFFGIVIALKCAVVKLSMIQKHSLGGCTIDKQTRKRWKRMDSDRRHGFHSSVELAPTVGRGHNETHPCDAMAPD